MKLLKSVVDALTYEGTSAKPKDIRWDERVPGFGLRLWPSGTKTFVYRYWFGTRQRYMTLGTYGSLTPDQAYRLALQTHAKVLAGTDPLADRKRLRLGETVNDLCRHYMEKHSRPHNKTWEKDQERIDAYIKPELGTLKVRSVKRSDISALHHKVGVTKKHPTTANRLLSLLSSMFNKARREYGFLDETAPNPADAIERFPEVKRRRFVTKDEMPKLAKAIVEEQNVFAQAAIWAYLLTGLRKEELLGLKWSDVDLKRGEVYLADTKAGRDHTLPLSAAAVGLFKSLPRLGANPYVFCGSRAGRPIVNISKPWKRIREAAGLADVRLHDLRRTVGSWLAMSGASLPLIGEVLNHSNASTTKVYARFHRDPVAEAMERHSRELFTATGGLLPVPPSAEDTSSAVDVNSRDAT